MTKKELERSIRREVEQWPGVTVTFEAARSKGHPKAKFAFGENKAEHPYPGSPSDGVYGLHRCLGDMRRVMKAMGAKREKPEPTADEDEAPYRKPNDGAEKRPDPVARERANPPPTIAEQLASAGLVKDGPELTGAEAIRQAAGAIQDGIYFGLPAEVYHAVPRLSASGLQRLCVSPATFWRGSWLDPDAPELDEEETKAQQLGKAYHVARLEPERFHDLYAREPSKDDYGPDDNLITSDTGIKAALKALDLTQTIGTESIADRARRLIEAGHEGVIFPLVMAEFEVERAGRIAIPARFFDQIETDMERVRGSGEIAELLTGGEAEVSIFWTDQQGLKMKSRLDYLKAAEWSDMKTFDNSRGKELNQALVDAVRYNRIYVQAVTYRDAVEAIRTGGLQIQGQATDAQRALVAAIQIRPDELACWLIFQEKNGIPNLLAREFPFFSASERVQQEAAALATDEAHRAAGVAAQTSRTQIHGRGAWEIDRAKRAFVLYSQVYQPGTPWFPIEPKGRFDDFDFNSFWLEGR